MQDRLKGFELVSDIHDLFVGFIDGSNTSRNVRNDFLRLSHLLARIVELLGNRVLYTFVIAIDFIIDMVKNFVDFLLRIFIIGFGFAIKLVSELV